MTSRRSFDRLRHLPLVIPDLSVRFISPDRSVSYSVGLIPSTRPIHFGHIFTLDEYMTVSEIQYEKRGYKETISYDEMIKDELDFITSFDFCPIYPNPTNPKLTNILPSKIRDDAEKEGYNIAVNQAISCLLVKIVNDMTDPEWRRWRTRQLYGQLLRIGEESTVGRVYASSMINVHGKQLIIKTAPITNSNTIIHEIMICTAALNNLRTEIPNFVYLYGYFNCTNPATNRTKETGNYCHLGKESTFIVYESISPSISAKELWSTPNLNAATVLSNFYQVILALQLAHERYDFTHYDLHLDNVLCKKLDYPQYIRYRSAKFSTPINILTDRIAVIIDFGMSHIRLGHKHYGYKDGSLQHFNLFSTTSFPGADCFRYLLMACHMLKAYPDPGINKLVNKLTNGLINTGTDDVSHSLIFDMISKFYYTMPYSPERKEKYGYDYFFNLLFTLFPEESKIIVNTEETPTDYPLYGCEGSMVCRTFGDVVSGFLNPDADVERPTAHTLTQLRYNIKDGKSYDDRYIEGILNNEIPVIKSMMLSISHDLMTYKNPIYSDLQHITPNYARNIASVADTIRRHSLLTEKIMAGFDLQYKYKIRVIDIEPFREEYTKIDNLMTEFKNRLVRNTTDLSILNESPDAEILYNMCIL